MRSSKHEFGMHTRNMKYAETGGACEKFGCLNKGVEIHHIVPIWWATEYFPQVAPQLLAIIDNAELLCREHHETAHEDLDYELCEVIIKSLIEKARRANK